MGLFDDDHHGHNHTCPMPIDYAVDGEKPFIGSISFHKFNMILSGGCTVLVILTVFILMALHATHLSRPREQIKIMKISALLPLYSITSWLCLAFPHQAAYIDPWISVFESAALGSFFLLMCEFISTDSRTELDLFFSAFQVPQKKGDKKRIGGLAWFRKSWIAIFQYPPIAVLIAIVTDITEAASVYCEESSKPYFAHIWLMVVGSFSLTFAITSIFGFYTALKTELKGHSPLLKLMAFKLIVGLSFLETILFTILKSTNALKPNSTLTYGDVNFGLPNLIVCLQTVPFALFFPFAYSHKPYLLSCQKASGLLTAEYSQGTYQNLPEETDLLRYQATGAIKFAFNMATKAKDRQSRTDVYSRSQNTNYDMSYESDRPSSNEHLMLPGYGQNVYAGYEPAYDPHGRSPSLQAFGDRRDGPHGPY
ncbi:hypothetical protein N7468_008831 [Penicillium chermesinum]|uniref:Organic solute transporter Ostalpha-domain-containing protein n=1 Tax=Penicillium chermesinum TaxID=63820 RepID=A0A9W9NGN0_9EURO|nr:uncharacterized protein N7468_008831 [Penicillium chermesinum]KAJ5219627.1 hypothetical protein N7468_008831 [Penicillium chermesinum]